MTPFEKQLFFFKPYTLVWKFDISPVTQEQLEIIESFESTVRDYLSKTPGHDGEFVQEFADLSMGVEITSRIDELDKNGLYAFLQATTNFMRMITRPTRLMVKLSELSGIIELSIW